MNKPVPQNFEETALPHFARHIQVRCKRARRFLINLQKKRLLAAEMLKNGALGDSELSRDIADACIVIPLFRKKAHGHIDDSGALAFGLRTQCVASATRGRTYTGSVFSHVTGGHTVKISHAFRSWPCLFATSWYLPFDRS